MLWFRKRIQMAIAITKEAARAVNDMKVCCPRRRRHGRRHHH